VVYLIPGLGAHRLAGNELGLAELIASNGFSVVCISSTFHPEFMEHASTSDLPDYPPNGIRDLQVALTEIDRHLDTTYPHRLGARALVGYSMGAFQALFLAATEATNAWSFLKFQRYVAIDAPVRLRFAVTNLDLYYKAPLAWPNAEREADIENALLKVAGISKQSPPPRASLPFDAIESKFLIGLSFRLTLRDMIFSSQSRHNLEILQQPIRKSRRQAVYDEILTYSFRDYIDKFATPYDKTRGIDLKNEEVVTPDPLFMQGMLQFTGQLLALTDFNFENQVWQIPASDPFAQAAEITPEIITGSISTCRDEFQCIRESVDLS